MNLSEVQESVCNNITDERIRARVRARIAFVWNRNDDTHTNLERVVRDVRELSNEIRGSCSELANKIQSILS